MLVHSAIMTFARLAIAVFVLGCGGQAPEPARPCPACIAAAPPAPASAPPPAEPPAPDPEPTEPGPPPNVEYSVSVDKNLEKGRAALAANDHVAARAYFTFVIARFPMSTKIHDAELGLLEVDTAQFIAEGRDDVDTFIGHCQFIEHHPWHPRVVNGEVACQVNKIQKTPCVAGQRVPSKYCGKVSYCAHVPKGELARRPECAVTK
jgi:hypothetical protein